MKKDEMNQVFSLIQIVLFKRKRVTQKHSKIRQFRILNKS